MKTKIIACIFCAFVLTGCMNTESQQIHELKQKYPTCEIRKIPNPSNVDEWLIKTPDNKILYVYFSFSEIVEHQVY
jgi:PBP1b-binding outer membrane lipoprotein LpoB